MSQSPRRESRVPTFLRHGNSWIEPWNVLSDPRNPVWSLPQRGNSAPIIFVNDRWNPTGQASDTWWWRRVGFVIKRGLRARDCGIFSYQQRRNEFRYFYCKWEVMDDGVTSEPLYLVLCPSTLLAITKEITEGAIFQLKCRKLLAIFCHWSAKTFKFFRYFSGQHFLISLNFSLFLSHKTNTFRSHLNFC